MVFSSLIFLFYFLPATFFLHLILPARCRNFVLFALSLLFYSWGEPVCVVLMLASITANYAFGLLIGRRRWPRFFFAAAIIFNLALLIFFKYAGFLTENLRLLTGMQPVLPELPLPLGISFYTFQAMSYIIDVFRGTVPPQKNFIAFGTYIALFPQLIAGPIVRYRDIALQLKQRSLSACGLSAGTMLFCCGLAKKVLLANSAGLIFDGVLRELSGGPVSALSAFLGIAAFTVQIYFDFSGYSDMASGLGRMLGFSFPRNFNYPYISQSITEFWRRWHMTLSSFFREYVYIPLGGNRRGPARQAANLLIVWLLTGIWHGASYNFLLWGLYFGLLLILEKHLLAPVLSRLPKVLRHLYALLLIGLGWVIFSVEQLPQIWLYLTALTGRFGFADSTGLYLLHSHLPFLLLSALGATPLPARLFSRLCGRLKAHPGLLSCLKSGLLLCALFLVTASLVASSFNPFLYFRF